MLSLQIGEGNLQGGYSKLVVWHKDNHRFGVWEGVSGGGCWVVYGDGVFKPIGVKEAIKMVSVLVFLWSFCKSEVN